MALTLRERERRAKVRGMIETLEAQELKRSKVASEGLLVMVVGPIAALAVGAFIGAASDPSKR